MPSRLGFMLLEFLAQLGVRRGREHLRHSDEHLLLRAVEIPELVDVEIPKIRHRHGNILWYGVNRSRDGWHSARRPRARTRRTRRLRAVAAGILNLPAALTDDRTRT